MKTLIQNLIINNFKRNLSGIRESLRIGDEITVIKKIKQKDVDEFSRLTGDTNPIHSIEMPPEKRLVHGAYLNGLVSGIIGTRLPGPGTIVLSQKLLFPAKCKVDKEIEIWIKLIENRKIMKIIYECRQDGIIVFKGDAKLLLMSTNLS